METQGCPVSRILLSASPVRSRGTQSNTSGTRLVARAARRKSMSTSSCLRGATPDFSSGLTSKAFPMNGYAARQRRFEIRVFLPLDELPSQVVEPHLPEATGFKAPEIRPSPFSGQQKQFRRAYRLSHTSRPGVGLGCQRLFELIPSTTPGYNNLRYNHNHRN